jgi:hypothetical protein
MSAERALRRARFSFISALLGSLGACAPAAGPPPSSKHWSVVRDDLDRVPLCAWGVSPSDVWIGGGGLAIDGPVLLLRGDGASFVEQPAPVRGTIWWIHGTGANDVWAVGEKGLALHWDGAAWSTRPTGTDANLYGVWAAAPDDVWAVGGSPTSSGSTDVLLHYDGASFTLVPPPRALGATYFKVWGLSSTDVLVVASAGLALHFDGTSWSEVATGSRATLFTVHGGSSPAGDFPGSSAVRAIGGSPPVLLRWKGDAFEAESTPPEMSGAMTGVFVDASGVTFITGERYQRYELDVAGKFQNDTDHPMLFGDLHAVWGDGRGNAVAVGGNYVGLTDPTVVPKGLVIRYGD